MAFEFSNLHKIMREEVRSLKHKIESLFSEQGIHKLIDGKVKDVKQNLDTFIFWILIDV